METTNKPQASKPPEIINLGYIPGEDDEYSNDPYSYSIDKHNGPTKYAVKRQTDTKLVLSLKDRPKNMYSPIDSWSKPSTSTSNSSTSDSKSQSPKDILQLAVNSMNSPPDFNVRKELSLEDIVKGVTTSKTKSGLFSQMIEDLKDDRPSSSTDLLKVSIPTANKAQKRKRLKKNAPNFETDAEKAEKERLERLQKMRENMPDFDDRNNLAPVSEPNLEQILQDLYQSQPSTSQEKDDEDVVILDETPNICKKTRVEQEEIVLSSDDETEIKNNSSIGINQPRLFTQEQMNKMRIEALVKVNQIHARSQQQKIRPRRNSNEYENSEIIMGQYLVNAGKPQEDPDIYVAEHLTHTLKPHQLGGVRFMYDNIIESLSTFKESSGFGCILAHSMGLGKTIQVITFIDIFFRSTQSKKALIICPVNTIQNWYQEFDKWMPKEKVRTGKDGNLEMINPRDFDVFLLSDNVKGLKHRAELIAEWHQKGGALIMGYEMFRILVKSKGVPKKKPIPNRFEHNNLYQPNLNFDFDDNEKAEDLDDIDEKELTETLHKGLVEALLNPGPDLVVCDEGHRIKNLQSRVAGALNSIRTKRRIVLTGYPIQNNLMEYYCMVNFVRPNFLGSKKDFSARFEKPIKNGQCIDSTPQDKKLSEQRIHVLTDMLKGFVHRRSQNILKKILPESQEYVVLVRKSPIQHTLYRSFVLYAQAEMQAQNANFYNPLKAYSICVKILNHPDLLYKAKLMKNKDRGDDSNENTRDSSNSNSKNYSPPLPTFGLGSTEPRIESNFYHDQQQNWNFGNQSNQVQNGYNNDNQFSNYHQPQPQFSSLINQYTNQNHLYQNRPTSNFTNFQQSIFNSNGNGQQWRFNGMDHHSQSVPNLNSWNNFGNESKPGTSNGIQASVGTSNGVPTSSEKTPSSENFKSKQKGRPMKKKQTLASILYGDDFDDTSIKYDWADFVMHSYIPEMAENSIKLLLAIELINETTRRGEKILFFSGSVMTLDILENFLLTQYKLITNDREVPWKKNENYCRFDGTTNATDREKYMRMFNETPDIYLFLISTKAGSLGVNLVSATRVIIFDASWNPCHDAQAVCRIYRYGQQKKTFIYRLIVNNCMEKAIFNRQISKQGLQQKVVDEKLVDANVLSKELENLLSYDEALDVYSGDDNVHGWEIPDDLLKSVIQRFPYWFAETPFMHESLMLEKETGLSEQEKAEAKIWYEREKCGLNRYDMFEQPPQIRHTQHVDERKNYFYNHRRDVRYPFMDNGHMRLTYSSPMPGTLVQLNQNNLPPFGNPTNSGLNNSRPNWDPNRPSLRLLPPTPSKIYSSPILAAPFIRLPMEVNLPIANNVSSVPSFVTLYPNEEVSLVRNVTVKPNKYFLKKRNGELLDANDQMIIEMLRGILGPSYFYDNEPLRPKAPPIQPGEIIELD